MRLSGVTSNDCESIKLIGSKKKNEEMAQEECFIGNAQTDAITKIDGLGT